MNRKEFGMRPQWDWTDMVIALVSVYVFLVLFAVFFWHCAVNFYGGF